MATLVSDSSSIDLSANRDDMGNHIDFVLAFNGNEQLNKAKRQIFEQNLANEGLILERDETKNIHFTKIHATREVLCLYSEILKFKFPIKLGENESEDQINHEEAVRSILGKFNQFFRLNRKPFPEKRHELFHEYSRDKSYLFDIQDPAFFPTFVRISVIKFILERTPFADNADNDCIGIDKLLSDGAYTASYPLHDGDQSDVKSQRGLLFNEWAILKNLFNEQPLDKIKNYFGVEVGLYFTWLGFYTKMLILPSILGVLFFIIGLSTMFTNYYANSICNANSTVVLCPKCDDCGYTTLSDTCIYARINHILDNNFTIVFALCMSIWASIYLELWKRYSAKILYQWGLDDFSEQLQHPRTAYITRIKRKKQAVDKINPTTGQQEPTLDFKFKLPNYMLSYTITILLMILSIAVNKLINLSLKKFYEDSIGSMQTESFLILFDYVARFVFWGLKKLSKLVIFNFLYDYLAVVLTDLEYRRTQTEYDNSLSLKMYLFKFINYYSSPFYIAFLKGKWTGTPKKHNWLFGYRQEECSPGGCLMELFIELSFIMIGNQMYKSLEAYNFPFIRKKYQQFRYGKQNLLEDENNQEFQYTRDYKLTAWESKRMLKEYLEIVTQYGFCTLFIIAFPLGPLFALIKNIFELRLDAKKFLIFYRRPVPKRRSDIGIWLGVMSVLSRISVLTTAFIIAFSTDFIPRLMRNQLNDLKNMDYLEFTFAYFRTADGFDGGITPNTTEIEFCRYPDYRNHPDHSMPYNRPTYYWQILAARLAFIIIFPNVVAWVQQFIDWVIPDKPTYLYLQKKGENYLVLQKIIDGEKQRDRSSQTNP